MEQIILKAVKKIRQMYRFDDRLNDVLKKNPTVHIEINDDGTNLEMTEIVFSWYDKVCVTSKGITYIPERGSSKTIIKYNGWDELIAL